MKQSNINDFLKELSELTKKHGIAIYSCGCCHALHSIFDQQENLTKRGTSLEYVEHEYQLK